MDKITYLAELAEGLARWVPERERQDILRYYAEYFDEAGYEHEAEVVAELGDPWALSCRLAVEGGFVTQEAANAWTPRQGRRKLWPLVLAGTLAAVVVVAVSVGFMASRVGRFVGNAVSSRVVDEVTVMETAFGSYDVASEDGPMAVAEGTGGFWTMEDGCLDMFETIDVDVSLGNVTICEGQDFTLFIGQSGGLGGYSVDWKVEGGVLKIRDNEAAVSHVNVTSVADLANLFGGRALDVSITVPQGFELNKITAKTKLGDVYLAQLMVAGKVEADTKMGNVECYEVCTANKIDLKTSMGDVNFGSGNFLGGMEVDLKTNMGNVEAQMGCTERECDYEAETSMGNVTVNGMTRGIKSQGRGDNAAYKLQAESDMGDVNVYFYDDRW